MSGPERIAENPAPYDVLTARVALVEAAKLNKDALDALSKGWTQEASLAAHVARSLSIYALALDRWSS